MSSSTLKWWHAQINLGWRSFLHYLKKLWPWRKKYGLARFRENYVPEGLPAYYPNFRQIAHEPGRCTTCGLCDVACPMITSGSRNSFLGPMRLVISGMRGGPILGDIAEELTIFSDENCLSCKKCEKACPEGIPIIALAQGFSLQLKEVQQMRT